MASAGLAHTTWPATSKSGAGMKRRKAHATFWAAPGTKRYAFGEYDRRPPFDRSANNGFRCVRYSQPVPDLFAAPQIQQTRDYSTEKPVPDEVFTIYRSMYLYEPGGLEPKVESVDESPDAWRKEKVTFRAAYDGERRAAYLFLPQVPKAAVPDRGLHAVGLGKPDAVERQSGVHGMARLRDQERTRRDVSGLPGDLRAEDPPVDVNHRRQRPHSDAREGFEPFDRLSGDQAGHPCRPAWLLRRQYGGVLRTVSRPRGPCQDSRARRRRVPVWPAPAGSRRDQLRPGASGFRS